MVVRRARTLSLLLVGAVEGVQHPGEEGRVPLVGLLRVGAEVHGSAVPIAIRPPGGSGHEKARVVRNPQAAVY
jgi:hypothetical protein